MENVVNQRFVQVINKLHLNKKQVADRLGVSPAAIQKIETNQVNVSKKMLQKMQDVFNVNPEWLLNGDGEMFIGGKPKKENSETIKERLAEFKGFLRGFLAQQNMENLWEKIEPNFPKYKQAV
jgi:transcriptional regulator with XRE-family HTH domain